MSATGSGRCLTHLQCMLFSREGPCTCVFGRSDNGPKQHTDRWPPAPGLALHFCNLQGSWSSQARLFLCPSGLLKSSPFNPSLYQHASSPLLRGASLLQHKNIPEPCIRGTCSEFCCFRCVQNIRDLFISSGD